MTNHVHLLLTPQQTDGPSLLMKHLGQRFVQYINRTYQRSGTLWEGRFRSCLAQNDHYALTCYRYIELNPVRASMVSRPEHYRWSSFRTNGHGAMSRLISPHPSYLALGTSAYSRLSNYTALFDNPIEESALRQLRHATNGNFAFGNERFHAEIEQALQRRVTPARAGRPRIGD